MNQSNTLPDGELSKSFEPADLEARWYTEWEKRGYFAAGQHAKGDANGAPYAIQFPKSHTHFLFAHLIQQPIKPSG